MLTNPMGGGGGGGDKTQAAAATATGAINFGSGSDGLSLLIGLGAVILGLGALLGVILLANRKG